MNASSRWADDRPRGRSFYLAGPDISKRRWRSIGNDNTEAFAKAKLSFGLREARWAAS